MKIIGLTGGIASGKSTASAILKTLGARVIDADQISREVVLPGTQALQEIRETFGPEVIDDEGRLIRSALARIVFNDPVKLARLNAITHPRIVEAIRTRLEAARSTERIVVLDAALLIELKLTDLVDEVWLVWVNRETQLERLECREGMAREDAEKIIRAQMPLGEKMKAARICIENNGSIEDLRKELTELWSRQVEQ